MLVAMMTGDASQEEHRCAVNKRLAVSDIVLWEMAKLIQRGRLVMRVDNPEFRSWLRNLAILPITLEIARMSTQFNFSSAPA
jgi:PIN domain nuclease of toxin-antitoxin system